MFKQFPKSLFLFFIRCKLNFFGTELWKGTLKISTKKVMLCRSGRMKCERPLS